MGDAVDRVTVACVQQRMRLHDSVDEYRTDLRRFLRIAQGKQAQLVVFPELAGALIAPPMLRDFRSTLLKHADRGRRKQASLWQRLRGLLAGRTAEWLGADFRQSLRALLAVSGQTTWEVYANLFSELAREHQLVLVAPSAYLPDPNDQVIRNLTAVFAADGSLLGRQAKVILHPEDEGIAQAADSWLPVPTAVGSLGLMVGSDVLYPEVGRLLAYQGAEMLLMVGACSTTVLYQKLRSGMLARMQDNQLFGLASFVVGHNELGRDRAPFVGRSAIFAPQELTPKLTGVLVEMGSPRSEGVLAAEWDFRALRQLWEQSDTPLRRELPLAQAGQILAQLYERLRALPSGEAIALPGLNMDDERDAPAGQLPLTDKSFSLDELPVIGVVTRRWSSTGVGPLMDDAPLDLSELPERLAAPSALTDPRRAVAEAGHEHSADEETDEMDALPEQEPGKSS